MCEFVEVGKNNNHELAEWIAGALRASGQWDGRQLLVVEDAVDIHNAILAGDVKFEDLKLTQRKFRVHVSLPDDASNEPLNDIYMKVWQDSNEEGTWYWSVSVFIESAKRREFLDRGEESDLDDAAKAACAVVKLYRSGGAAV